MQYILYAVHSYMQYINMYNLQYKLYAICITYYMKYVYLLYTICSTIYIRYAIHIICNVQPGETGVTKS